MNYLEYLIPCPERIKTTVFIAGKFYLRCRPVPIIQATFNTTNNIGAAGIYCFNSKKLDYLLFCNRTQTIEADEEAGEIFVDYVSINFHKPSLIAKIVLTDVKLRYAKRNIANVANVTINEIIEEYYTPSTYDDNRWMAYNITNPSPVQDIIEKRNLKVSYTDSEKFFQTPMDEFIFLTEYKK